MGFPQGILTTIGIASTLLSDEINASLPNVFLTEDDTVLHLECLLHGYTPSSELYWYHEAAIISDGQSELQRITNGVRHETDEEFQIQIGGRLPGFGVRSVLSLPSPTEVNVGRYLCALPGNLRENATIDVQLLSTETPVLGQYSSCLYPTCITHYPFLVPCVSFYRD